MHVLPAPTDCRPGGSSVRQGRPLRLPLRVAGAVLRPHGGPGRGVAAARAQVGGVGRSCEDACKSSWLVPAAGRARGASRDLKTCSRRRNLAAFCPQRLLSTYLRKAGWEGSQQRTRCELQFAPVATLLRTLVSTCVSPRVPRVYLILCHILKELWVPDQLSFTFCQLLENFYPTPSRPQGVPHFATCAQTAETATPTSLSFLPLLHVSLSSPPGCTSSCTTSSRSCPPSAWWRTRRSSRRWGVR